MPKYLITYHDGAPMPEDPDATRQIVEAFGAWVASVGDAMIDAGAPLSISKTITTAGITDGQQAAAIGGYSIIQAIDLDAATKLLRGHLKTV